MWYKLKDSTLQDAVNIVFEMVFFDIFISIYAEKKQ